MPTSGKQLLKEALQAGWVIDRQSGSHTVVKKLGHVPVSIPIHGNRDLKKGTEHGIRKQLGLKKPNH